MNAFSIYQINDVSQIFYKMNYAVRINHLRQQWINLGNHPEACMTRPETCGHTGGAVSLWVRRIFCEWGPILTAASAQSSGVYLRIFCYNDSLW